MSYPPVSRAPGKPRIGIKKKAAHLSALGDRIMEVVARLSHSGYEDERDELVAVSRAVDELLSALRDLAEHNGHVAINSVGDVRAQAGMHATFQFFNRRVKMMLVRRSDPNCPREPDDVLLPRRTRCDLRSPARRP